MADAPAGDAAAPQVVPRVPPALVDVALAILVTVAVALAISAKVEPEALEPDVFAYLFAVGLGALMLVRRRWPAGVLIATMVLLFAYYTIGYPAVGVSVPIAGAVYSAAEQGRLRLAIAVSAVVMVVTTLYRMQEEPLAKLLGFEAAQNLVLLVAVIALGDSIRARREVRRQSWLRAERARIDHERDAREQVEQERLRIAREVHDVLAHSVSAISIQSVVGLEALPDEPDNAAAALRSIRQVSTSALADLRSAVGVLRDPAGDRQPAVTHGRDRSAGWRTSTVLFPRLPTAGCTSLSCRAAWFRQRSEPAGRPAPRAMPWPCHWSWTPRRIASFRSRSPMC